MINIKHHKNFIISIIVLLTYNISNAQTDLDAIMMKKNELCIGPMYNKNSWKNYWEGSLKRTNENLGTVTTKAKSLMGNFGICNKLNLIFSLPYINTKASAGQLHSMKGLQDATIWIKYMPVEKMLGKGTLSIYSINGISIPTTNYVADYLPLSIGLHSTNISFRAMVDYQINNWFATLSGTYILRNNVKIDRTSYYTTQLHYSNIVSMPNVTQINFRTGIRNETIIAEAVLNNFTTQGGFDITKNNMPFISNKMNTTTCGVNAKYTFKKHKNFAITGGYYYTLAGRNVGQSNNINLGVFYVIGIAKSKIKKSIK